MVERFILHKMFEKLPPGAKRVTRPSTYANPFKIKEHGGPYTREEALKKYEEWLQNKLKEIPKFLDPLKEYKFLACYCKPLSTPCHVDILIKYLNKVN